MVKVRLQGTKQDIQWFIERALKNNKEVEVFLVNIMSRELILQQYIDQMRSFYDYILIDTQPSLGMITINAVSLSYLTQDEQELTLPMVKLILLEKQSKPVAVTHKPKRLQEFFLDN